MSEVRITPEWDDSWPDGLAAAVDKARREDPEYDRLWREGLQRMADEIDQRALFEVYSIQRTGDEPV